MPGCLIAMARVNRPALMIYGGTIRAGHLDGAKLDVVSAFQSYGEFLVGTIDEGQRKAIVKHSCPGAGACGGMYTANTMASAIEAMGMSLPYSASRPADSQAKRDECLQAGAAIRTLLEKNIKPSDIMTPRAFENAMVVITALGGSTNAVLHMIAMARAINVSLTIDDFQRISDRVPLLADMKPSGSHVQEDLDAVGGIPGLMKTLLETNLLHGDCLTVTGRSLAENLADLPTLAQDQTIIRPLDRPIHPNGHIQILRGSLAPEGAVAKITGKEGLTFTGPANVFDSEEEMLSALERGAIHKGDVVIIRFEGPKGGRQRLTQPGRIAIVYAHPKERREIRQHIEFLQNRGHLRADVEHIDLEDLPPDDGSSYCIHLIRDRSGDKFP